MKFRWPLPALLAWGSAWLAFVGLTALGVAPGPALLVASALGLPLGLAWGDTSWRRLLIFAGFPASLLVSGLAASVPAWAWLAPLALLLLLYPIAAWRDAPLFPTPAGALRGLAERAPLPPGARILDAGCGLGDGLRELHREYPQAGLEGIERSGPLRLACAGRCRFARIRRGDLWTADWSAYDLVYLFQRPESMPRAAEKAARELAPGAWLVSLEFEATSLAPRHTLECVDGRRVWLYQAPFRAHRSATREPA
ncbi:MAG: class I SAM-dependent methyltransferase [Myxococcota bacterium]